MNAPRRAFTLVELIVAMGIGIFVALGAYTAFRMSAQTMAAVNRLSLENRMMRNGIEQALHDADFWTSLDDPGDPANQPLRQTVARNTDYAPNTTEGGLFVPFRSIPVYGDPTPGTWQQVPVRIRETEAILDTAAQLRDGTRVFDRDLDRGWDPRRPYVAADPRTWFRGNLCEENRSDKRMGRYNILTNKRRHAVAGFGSDPREPGGYCRDPHFGCLPPTGPYGPYDNYATMPARTFTWRDNQVAFLHQALGYYGMMDYLPSNSVYATYGTWILGMAPSGGLYATDYPALLSPLAPETAVTDPGGVYLWSDEHYDYRFAPYVQYYAKGNVYTEYASIPGDVNNSGPAGGQYGRVVMGNRLGRGPNVSIYSSGRTFPIFPRSRYTGLYESAIGVVDGSNGPATWDITNLGGPRPLFSFYGTVYSKDEGDDDNLQLSAEKWMEYQRLPFLGENAQPHELAPMWYRIVHMRPVARQRPVSWPELHVASARILWRAHFLNLCSVRWTDNHTGQVAELKFNALGTTLRGARQQRRQDQGWAAWYGPDDARNDKTLDSP